MKDKIGSGAFGDVYYSIDPKTNVEYAIKIINKSKISSSIRQYLDREVTILKKLDHENVVKLHDFKMSDHNYYLVFEYCNGNDLKYYLNNVQSTLNESMVRDLLRQIVRGLSTIYSIGGIHRDIKLSNILLHYPDEEAKRKGKAIVKVCDLGFARMLENTESPMEMSIVGTPMNMSPEMVNQKPYSIQSDIWSLGTITYEMLCGDTIFKGININQLKKSLDNGEYKVSEELNLSLEAIHFLVSCIRYNPEQRINWKELATHPFLCGDKVTPFDYKKFVITNAGGNHRRKNYFIFNSKFNYKFDTLYKSKSGFTNMQTNELIFKNITQEFIKVDDKLNLKEDIDFIII